MIKFKSNFSGGIRPERRAQKSEERALWAACFGLAVIFTVVAAQAKGPASFGFSLGPASKPIADKDKKNRDFVPPTVFQAAGPNAASIQSTVDAFRAALGNPSNGNAGPLTTGHREINWDGAPPTDATTAPVNPFNVFLNTRGSQFTTPGIGLSQAPPSGGPQGGLAVLFNNATYGTTFKAFSPSRLFTPVGSNITNGLFFLPGSNGTVRATVTGFGAVFSDVDQQDGSGPGKKHEREGGEREEEERRGNRGASTLVEFFDADGELLFSSFVPASPGDGGFSFFGIKFNDARIASVRIKAGDVAPGPDDDSKNDIVMMDDFIYGEPQVLP
jgi:hypothetical protein